VFRFQDIGWEPEAVDSLNFKDRISNNECRMSKDTPFRNSAVRYSAVLRFAVPARGSLLREEKRWQVSFFYRTLNPETWNTESRSQEPESRRRNRASEVKKLGTTEPQETEETKSFTEP
jgi:hypothetical protein